MARPRILRPARSPLVNPTTGRRVLRAPDLRGVFGSAEPSALPLSDNEDMADEVVLHRHWIELDPEAADDVRYICYQFSQRLPGEQVWRSAVKAVRFVRLTRVPRYLRAAGGSSGGPAMVFQQQRDVLAALCQERVLFVNLIAKSPDLPLVFAYGVSAVGATIEEARSKADEGHAVLCHQLDGTYQQLQYAPLRYEEAERIVRYQNNWQHVAAARGRPLPRAGGSGVGSLLDGNRTDVENANNLIESFIRGMSDRSFLMNLITYPLAPAEISHAWANLTEKLSEVRSEQSGTRSAQAGIAIPFAMGHSIGDQAGNTHSTGLSEGVGVNDGVSASETQGVSASHTTGESASLSDSVSHTQSASHTTGESASVTEGVNAAFTAGESAGQSVSLADSVGSGVTHGESMSLGESTAAGTTASMSQGESLSAGESHSQGISVGESRSVTDSLAAGSNWAQSVGQSQTASVGQSEGISRSLADSLTQTFNHGLSWGEGGGGSSTRSDGSNFGGSLGLSGGLNSSLAQQISENWNKGGTFGESLAGGSTLTNGVNFSQNSGLSQGVTVGESSGGSVTQSQAVSQGQNIGQNETVGRSMTQGVSQGVGLSESLSQGRSLSQGVSLASSDQVGRTAGMGANQGSSTALSQGESLAASRGVSASETQGVSASQGRTATQGVSVADTVGESASATQGVSQGTSANRAMNDAFMVAQARTAGSTGSMGLAPSFGVGVSRNTFNESKRTLGDVIDAQARRYLEGVESGGAYLYQLTLITPDRDGLVGGAGLLKSAFWGPGTTDSRLPQPFYVDTDPGAALGPDAAARERAQLRSHAALYTTYRRRETAVELIEPYEWSTYVAPSELATMCYPPTSEALGLMAQADSMPVLALPSDRADREVYLGNLVDGERARVTNQGFGLDAAEFTHTLIAGTSGSGKTTTLLRLLHELSHVKKIVRTPASPGDHRLVSTTAHAGILAIDWKNDLRRLVQTVEPERFRFFSVEKAHLGAFRWNPLAVPSVEIDPSDWLSQIADNFVAAWSLGETGRGLIYEYLDTLYRANRLRDVVLRPALIDEETGEVLLDEVILPAVDPATLPAGAIDVDPLTGEQYTNVTTCPALSRTIGLQHIATLVLASMDAMSSVEGGRAKGTAERDRLQSLWKRLQQYTAGSKLGELISYDESLDTPRCLTVSDLVDPDRGLVTVLETDGLDSGNRSLILGSVLLAVYRTALARGDGSFNQRGQGPGTFIVMEEAHELLEGQRSDEDGFSATARINLYESMFRRARSLGLRLTAVVQNPGDIPAAVTSNTTTVFIHRLNDEADRKVAFNLLNWSNVINQQVREWRYLGEMAEGFCIARLHARESWLESAPIQFRADPAPLAELPDDASFLPFLEQARAAQLAQR